MATFWRATRSHFSSRRASFTPKKSHSTRTVQGKVAHISCSTITLTQEVEEKWALPKILDACLFLAMSLFNFHISRTNRKGFWFIVWLKMHWKELNFPSEDCQNTKNRSAFGVGKSWSSLLPIRHMEHGLCNSQGLGKNDPARRRTMGGPQALAHQKAGTPASLGLKGLSWSAGGPCPALCPHKEIFLGLCCHKGRGKDSVPGFSGKRVTCGISWWSREGGRSEAEVCPLRGREHNPLVQLLRKPVCFTWMFLEECSALEVVFPHLPAWIWVGSASASQLVPSVWPWSPSSPFSRAKEAEQEYCPL